MRAIVSLNPTYEEIGTWDMDKKIQPEDFTKHYPQACWAEYGARENALFYVTPKGVYYWAWALGAEDMSKVWIPQDKTIITSNKEWAGFLKSIGYKVKVKVTVLN